MGCVLAFLRVWSLGVSTYYDGFFSKKRFIISRILNLTDSSLQPPATYESQPKLAKPWTHKQAMTDVSEDRVDLLEEKMRAKIDTMTGFSDVEGKSRALHKARETVAKVDVLAVCMNSSTSNAILSKYNAIGLETAVSCCQTADVSCCKLCLIAGHPLPTNAPSY